MNGLIFSNIAGSVGIFSVLLFRKFFKDKVFAKVFVLLWLAVMVRLLLPFEFSSGASIYTLIQKPETENAINQPVFIDDLYGEDFIAPEQNPVFSETPAKQKAKISSEQILLSIWCFGAVFFGGTFALRHRKNVKKLLACCVSFDEVPKEFSGGKTRFYKSAFVASPLSFGIFRPVIIIPEDTSENQLSFVLLHEHTHIKDRDAVLKALALFTLSLNWFNPAVWFMVKIFDRDIERYCDERVLFALGREKASLYANTILDFAERESFSLSFFSAASLYERVTSIMNNKNKKRKTFSVITVFAAVVLIMTACGTVPEPKEKEPLSVGNLSAETSAAEEFDKLLQDYVEVKLEDSQTATVDITAEEYITLSEITEKGYYAVWMQPGSVIVYDSEGRPEIEKGGELSVEEISGREDISAVGFTDFSPEMEIIPETKVEYDLHGFIQNIYFLWPDGSYNLSPAETENSGPVTTEGVVAFYWPCEARTISANAKSRPGHNGIDIATGYGADVFASASGKVAFAGKSDEGLGYYIVIAHDYGYSTVYAHCSELYVITGQNVETGEIIAKAGSSGNSTGPHLHFEILYNEVQLDPEFCLQP
ncbi:MAG: peptidoglycan DD-metalloendopeptidase family protein [Oscillospiraceae bacterium]|nr:peptidoglycan DD-metalloendopeptidase family protein [Oscillospiraceae bacterium]